MKENFLKGKFQEREKGYGLMVLCTRVNFRTERNMVMGRSHMVTPVRVIKEIGN